MHKLKILKITYEMVEVVNIIMICFIESLYLEVLLGKLRLTWALNACVLRFCVQN
jgi:hypothetical protein